jgi:hypothetical protein
VSSPYEEGPEFSIELGPQGELAPHLDKLQLGDTKLCKVAKGRFTLDIKKWPHRTFSARQGHRSRPFAGYGAQCTRIGEAGPALCPMPMYFRTKSSTRPVSPFQAESSHGRLIVATDFCGRRRQPRTFVGIPACAKTGKASFSAPVGTRVPCSKRAISLRRRMRRPSSRSGRFVVALTSHDRCTIRPGQNPNPYQV